MQWLKDQWARFIKWRDSFKPCYKESLGYNCKHRVYEDGTKECGEHPENYWKGDNE